MAAFWLYLHIEGAVIRTIPSLPLPRCGARLAKTFGDISPKKKITFQSEQQLGLATVTVSSFLFVLDPQKILRNSEFTQNRKEQSELIYYYIGEWLNYGHGHLWCIYPGAWCWHWTSFGQQASFQSACRDHVLDHLYCHANSTCCQS